MLKPQIGLTEDDVEKEVIIDHLLSGDYLPLIG